MINKFVKFFTEVKLEANKVVWPQPKEALNASVIVVVMAIIASLFFLSVDTIMYKLVSFIISL